LSEPLVLDTALELLAEEFSLSRGVAREAIARCRSAGDHRHARQRPARQ
jgi:DNA-binding FadR family transcriptional regulator